MNLPPYRYVIRKGFASADVMETTAQILSLKIPSNTAVCPGTIKSTRSYKEVRNPPGDSTGYAYDEVIEGWNGTSYNAPALRDGE